MLFTTHFSELAETIEPFPGTEVYVGVYSTAGMKLTRIVSLPSSLHMHSQVGTLPEPLIHHIEGKFPSRR